MSRLLEQNFLSSQLQKIRLSASYEPLAPQQQQAQGLYCS